MSQFKANLSTQKSLEKESKPHCPHCKSTNIKSISGLNRGASIAFWGISARKSTRVLSARIVGILGRII